MKGPDISHLLVGVANGEPDAHNELFRLVYDTLRQTARFHVRRTAGGLTINPTTLVHEAWIKFARSGSKDLKGSAHFYNIVAQAMRQIVHDMTAKKVADKRGHGLVRVDLSDEMEQSVRSLDELLAIDYALDRLRLCDEALCELVEWHYLVGLSLAEIAAVREVSERTLKRQLALARTFLVDAMDGARD